MSRRLRPTAAVGVLGTATLAAGVVATFVQQGAAGAATLVGTGAGLVLASLFARRLRELSFGSGGVAVKMTEDVRTAAGPEAARKLEEAGLAEFVDAYTLIQEELHPHERFMEARVHLQDLLVSKAASVAMRVRLHPEEVQAIFRNGSPVLRVLSLGLMQGDPSLSSFDCMVSAIAEARTPNEQYHGLRLAKQLWDRMTPEQQGSVLAAIRADREIPRSTDRRRVAEEIEQLVHVTSRPTQRALRVRTERP